MDTPGIVIVIIVAALAGFLRARSLQRTRRASTGSEQQVSGLTPTPDQLADDQVVSDARVVRYWTGSVAGVGLCGAIAAEWILPFNLEQPFRAFKLFAAAAILVAYWAGRWRAIAFGRDRYARVVSYLQQHGDFFQRHFWALHLVIAAAVFLILSGGK